MILIHYWCSELCILWELYGPTSVLSIRPMNPEKPHLTPQQKLELKEIILPLVSDLQRVAMSLCRNSCNAEELVAESIASACEHFWQLRDRSKAKQWLLRIMSNTFIGHCRTRKRHREVELPSDDQPDENNFTLFDQLSAPFLMLWGNPEREVINKLMDEDIRRAIESLSEEFRVAIVLCDVEGFSYAEIASTLKIPIGTVRSRIARGRRLLQHKLWHYAYDAGIIKTSPRKGHIHHAETETRS